MNTPPSQRHKAARGLDGNVEGNLNITVKDVDKLFAFSPSPPEKKVHHNLILLDFLLLSILTPEKLLFPMN